MKKKEKTHVLVFITHSLSEVNVLFPIFATLLKDRRFTVNLIFTVRKIYDAYRKDPFLQYCSKVLQIQADLSLLPNKFDGHFRSVGASFLGRRVADLVSLFWVLGQLRNLSKPLWTCDIYMHEISSQRNATRLLYLFRRFFRKQIFTYHHGVEISIDKRATGRKPRGPLSTMLVFHQHNSNYMRNLGYSNQAVIGYPIFFTEWHDLIQNYTLTKNAVPRTVLIYSRHITERYMDEEKYRFLLKSSLSVIRRSLPQVKIVVKPHPREDLGHIQNVINETGVSNVVISHEHPAILAKNAIFAITFWGSVVLESLSVHTPSIEYYVEAHEFRKDYPSGSNYKTVGISSADNEKDLEKFVRSVLKNEYRLPSIVKEFSSFQDLRVFY